MKRFFLFLAVAFAAAAHADEQDSVRLYHLQQIEVKGTRATKQTPVAYVPTIFSKIVM